MKKNPVCAMLIALMLATTVRGAPPPTEDFSHEAAYKNPTLSPDGQMLAYAETIKGENRIYLLDLATKKKIGLELLGHDKAAVQFSYFFWANNRRFVYYVPRTGTYTAIDRDGSRGRTNIRGGGLVHAFRDEKEGRLLMTGRDVKKSEGDELGRDVQFYYGNRTFVHEVNPSEPVPVPIGVAVDLAWAPYRRVADNPGNVVEWVATADGQVKAAKEIRGTHYRTLYRRDDKFPFGPLPGLDWGDPQAYPLGFSADGGTLYVGRVTPEGTWGVYPYDLFKKSVGEPLIAHKKYDIVHPGFSAHANGVGLQELIYSPKERALLGVRYTTEYPRVLWFDAGLAEVQAALDQALPKKINSITSMSDDLQRLVVLSWNAQDPGTYYLFDRRAQKLEKLLARMPWIDPAAMADTLAVRYKARDGVAISGYLTLPQGKGRTNLPLVVMPHNHTWGRHVWGFDSFVQFLASRGYAVLEVDFRGSAGYGEAFRVTANKRSMEAAVADCADGAHWAVAQKFADPVRIGIVGHGVLAGSYALMSLVRESDTYCCAVDGIGITEWVRSAAKFKVLPDELVAWREKFGDPAISAEAAVLAENSPINHVARIKAPVLITHAWDDADWFYNQSKKMSELMQQAGGKVEFNDKYDEKFGYLTMAKYMNDNLAFLQKHMPAEK
jgi:dipeptidyl aminopeptidase/acylaminoacyl peptidase